MLLLSHPCKRKYGHGGKITAHRIITLLTRIEK